jgi:hypothetical protein
VFILYAVALGVLLGFLAGGRPAGLATLRLRWQAAIMGGLLFQVVLFAEPVAERVGDLGPVLYVGSTLVVVAAMVRNWRVSGIPVVVAGSACNLAAVLANGGFMPASPGALVASGKAAPVIYSNSSVVPDPALWPLTDIFALPSWLPLANVFSVGDVLIGAGIALVIVIHMRRRVVAAAPPAGVGDPVVRPRTDPDGYPG